MPLVEPVIIFLGREFRLVIGVPLLWEFTGIILGLIRKTEGGSWLKLVKGVQYFPLKNGVQLLLLMILANL